MVEAPRGHGETLLERVRGLCPCVLTLSSET